MEPWEDELLWDDDFSDEEEDTEKQIENGSNEKFGQRLCGGWRKQPGRNPIFWQWWTNGTSWTGIGSAGNVTTKTCVETCRWSFRLYLIRRLLPSG